MGCICGKDSAIQDSRESPRERQLNKGSSEVRVARAISSRREESFRVKERQDNGDVRVGLIDKKANGSRRVRDDHFEKKREHSQVVLANYPAMGSVPKATEGEQVAAGWPSWLAAAAGEAVEGWLPRRADTFEKLDKIGQGTYSSVYKARDLIHKKVVALKRVRFDNLDLESVKFMAREILVLRRLDHPNIIKLEGLVTSRTSCSLYLVFEYMEHDLTGLASLPGVKFMEPQIKCYMQQLLSGLDHCHSRGVLHRDIKGSNLLLDNHGILKIADFGLASFFDHHQSFPLTSRVVTLWYRPPELLLGATYYGVSVDLWSSGCILGELYAGKPIMPGRTEVEQLHKIFKLCGSPSEDYWRKSKLPHSTVFKPLQPYKQRLAETFKNFPPAAVGLMETLLSVDPAHRGTAAGALKNEYFTTKPFPCDPSSLPKYPPSKEIDAKLRDEEARRQGAAGGRGQRDQETRRPKEPRAIPAAGANAELVTSMKRRQGHSNLKSRSELFNPHQEEAASGFPIDPPRQSQAVKEVGKELLDHIPKRATHSGPLVPGVGWTKAGKKYDDISIVSTRADLSTLSGLVASRTVLSEEGRDKLVPSQPEATNQVGRLSESYEELGPTRKQDRKHHIHSNAGSHLMENGRASTKEPVLHGHGMKGNKIHFSGPLLVPSNNVDQMLKERDRHLQEAARRARLEKRLGKVQAQGMQIAAYPICVSSRGAG
uniref:Protein kinase domain-containing protein n=2 Tax=Davidia involucrata TaxID=16924 RepID=A0A5B6YXM7_DAVIN